MNNTIEKIRAKLNEKFVPTYLEITDQSALHAGHAENKGGGHYTVTITAAQFSTQDRLTIHREIYAALGNMMHTEIHALRIVIKPMQN